MFLAPGAPWAPQGPHGATMWPQGVSLGFQMGPMGPNGAQWALAPWGPRAPRGYIDKLPINRPDGGVLVRNLSQNGYG